MPKARFPLSSYDAVRRGLICCVPVILALQGVAPASAQTTAAAQTAATAQNAGGAPEALQQREQELDAARQQQKNSAELQAKLKAELASIGEDRSKLNQQLIDVASRVRDAEARVADAEAKL